MSNLNNTATSVSLRRARMYAKLMKNVSEKSNKTDEDRKALASYRKIHITAIIAGILIAVIFAITFVSFFTGGSDVFLERRYGVVEGDRVKYTQNETKYVELSKLNINANEVSDGDQITLEFENDELTGRAVITEKADAADKKRTIALAISVALIIAIFTLVMVIIRNTMGKPFKEYVLQNTCRMCGKLNFDEVGTDDWTCIRCNTRNYKNADYTEYVKKSKRESIICTIICIIIGLLLAPAYLKATDTNVVPEKTQIEMTVPEYDSVQEPTKESTAIDDENEDIKSVEGSVNEINNILDNLN